LNIDEVHVFVPFHCLVEIKISDASGAEMVLLMRHFAVVSFAVGVLTIAG
jgi:hypothetical protein